MPQRDARGRALPGNSLNPAGGGRKPLPDWFKDRGPDALLLLLAAATGQVVEIDGITTAAHRDVAANTPPHLRIDAAGRMVDRIYGKAAEHMSVDGQQAITKIVRVFVHPDGRSVLDQ